MTALKTRRARLRLEPLDERALPSGYRQTNLVSDEPGQARIQDVALVNAWGMALNPNGGALWVSAHGTGTSPLYTGDVNGSNLGRPFAVAITGGAPTGQVFNGTQDFRVVAGAANAAPPFIFAGETGFITGWSPVVPAAGSRISLPGVSRPGAASYTGLAIANNGTANFLYAADRQNGRIDVFDAVYAPATLAGNFTDPNLPAGYMPYNIQAIEGKLYVTYQSDNPRGGGGAVNEFDLNGNFLRRIATGGGLQAPWGLAKAPADFGTFSNALLVANHKNGQILAYDLATGDRLGRLTNESGKTIQIDGLYGLQFGNGISFGDRNALYFTAGPRDGQDGLVGSLRFVATPPEDPRGGGGGGTRGLSTEGIARGRSGPGAVDQVRPAKAKAIARLAQSRPAIAVQAAVKVAPMTPVRPTPTVDLNLGEVAGG